MTLRQNSNKRRVEFFKQVVAKLPNLRGIRFCHAMGDEPKPVISQHIGETGSYDEDLEPKIREAAMEHLVVMLRAVHAARIRLHRFSAGNIGDCFFDSGSFGLHSMTSLLNEMTDFRITVRMHYWRLGIPQNQQQRAGHFFQQMYYWASQHCVLQKMLKLQTLGLTFDSMLPDIPTRPELHRFISRTDIWEDLGYLTLNGLQCWGGDLLELLAEHTDRNLVKVGRQDIQLRRMTWPQFRLGIKSSHGHAPILLFRLHTLDKPLPSLSDWPKISPTSSFLHAFTRCLTPSGI